MCGHKDCYHSPRPGLSFWTGNCHHCGWWVSLCGFCFRKGCPECGKGPWRGLYE